VGAVWVRCGYILHPKVWCLVFGAGARCGCGVGLSYNQRLGVWCCVKCCAKLNKPSKSLVYLTTKGLVFGAVAVRCGVRCGFILHPSFSLVLGLVLRERIKSKE
jgi:hypothetical protein